MPGLLLTSSTGIGNIYLGSVGLIDVPHPNDWLGWFSRNKSIVLKPLPNNSILLSVKIALMS
ncbi:MAG: hypothetical protein JWQ14_1305 [Adhaeribacter sp.]|nr:hypothetical protein [Adhaeribacter sp.]